MAAPAPRPIRTSDLKSKVMNVAQTSIYQVSLQPPPAVLGYLRGRGFEYNIDGESMELMCESTSIPGSSFMTIQNNSRRGVSEDMPYMRSYDNIQFTFYVNYKYDIIEFFEGWMDYINGIDEVDNYNSPYASYRMRYPGGTGEVGSTGYKTNIFLTKFERNIGSQTRDNNPNYQLDYTFVNAFPISTIPAPIGYAGSDVLKYSVNMSYIRYTRKRTRIGG